MVYTSLYMPPYYSFVGGVPLYASLPPVSLLVSTVASSPYAHLTLLVRKGGLSAALLPVSLLGKKCRPSLLPVSLLGKKGRPSLLPVSLLGKKGRLPLYPFHCWARKKASSQGVIPCLCPEEALPEGLFSPFYAPKRASQKGYSSCFMPRRGLSSCCFMPKMGPGQGGREGVPTIPSRVVGRYPHPGICLLLSCL